MEREGERQDIIMKKKGILNADIARVLAYMGHTDQIAVADCGLPIPEETERIDLAVRLGEPSFLSVLEAVLDDMEVEAVVLAEEIRTHNAQLLERIELLLLGKGVDVEQQFVPHSRLKEQTKQCRAVVRTGESSPYANIILQSGCIF